MQRQPTHDRLNYLLDKCRTALKEFMIISASPPAIVNEDENFNTAYQDIVKTISAINSSFEKLFAFAEKHFHPFADTPAFSPAFDEITILLAKSNSRLKQLQQKILQYRAVTLGHEPHFLYYINHVLLFTMLMKAYIIMQKNCLPPEHRGSAEQAEGGTESFNITIHNADEFISILNVVAVLISNSPLGEFLEEASLSHFKLQDKNLN